MIDSRVGYIGKTLGLGPAIGERGAAALET